MIDRQTPTVDEQF